MSIRYVPTEITVISLPIATDGIASNVLARGKNELLLYFEVISLAICEKFKNQETS